MGQTGSNIAKINIASNSLVKISLVQRSLPLKDNNQWQIIQKYFIHNQTVQPPQLSITWLSS